MNVSTSERQKRLRSNNIELILVAFGYAILVILYVLAHRSYFPAVYVGPLDVVLIAVGGYFAVRIANAFLEKIEPALGITGTHAIKNLLEVVIGIVVITVIFTTFGVNITSILIGAGFLGIVLGLAAQQVLGNIFAGATLFVSKPFEIGDRLTIANSSYSMISTSYPHESQINGFTGTVQDIGIFFTKVLLDEGTPSVFPNSVVIGSLLINHSRVVSRTVRVRVNVDKKIEFHAFEAKIAESLKKYKDLELLRCEIFDIGTETYQIAIIVQTRSAFEEPIRTIVLEEVIKIGANV